MHRLYYKHSEILHMGLEHPWLLVSEEVGSWNKPPLDSEEQLYCYYTYFADDKVKASVAPVVDLPQISQLISCLAPELLFWSCSTGWCRESLIPVNRTWTMDFPAWENCLMCFSLQGISCLSQMIILLPTFVIMRESEIIRIDPS